MAPGGIWLPDWNSCARLEMLDRKGRLIRLGDRLDVGDGWAVGVVVCSIDTGDYSAEHPKEAWGYLERGIMIDTDKAGLIHYTDNSQELEVIDPA